MPAPSAGAVVLERSSLLFGASSARLPDAAHHLVRDRRGAEGDPPLFSCVTPVTLPLPKPVRNVQRQLLALLTIGASRMQVVRQGLPVGLLPEVITDPSRGRIRVYDGSQLRSSMACRGSAPWF